MTKLTEQLSEQDRVNAGKFIFSHLVQTKLMEDLYALEQMYGIQLNISAKIVPIQPQTEEVNPPATPTEDEVVTVADFVLAEPEE